MTSYDDSVFINVPFDRKYARLSDAVVFAVHDCDAKLDHRELTFGDYTQLIVGWLASNPW